METTGITLGEAMSLCNNNGNYNYNAMWNNPIWAMAFMSYMNGGFGWGNRFGGFGGFGGTDYVNQAQLAQGLDNQDKNSQLRGIANGLADLGYALNNAVKDGNTAVAKEIGDVGAGISKSVNDMAAGMAMGFCNTNHNIDNLKYENAKNTADIITNATANTQRIMDGICGLKMDAKDAQIAALTGQLADAKLNLSQLAQSAYIVDKLTPAT